MSKLFGEINKIMDKSKYNEVKQGTKTDRTFPIKGTELKAGDSIEGRYIEKNTNIGDNNSTMYILEVGNEMVGVWGSTVLDTKFKSIATGKMVAIEYLGKKKSETGARTYKDFWVGTGIDTIGDEGGRTSPKNKTPQEDLEDYEFPSKEIPF